MLTLATWSPAYISNDGVQYLSTAENWLTGNGFSTDALIYAPHFQGDLPAIQTVWPPGYPFAISMTSLLGFDLEITMLILNLIMHATAALVIWRIFLKMGMEKFFAATCAFAFYFMALPWAYASAGMTEPLFTTLLLLGMLFLPVPNKSNLFYWIACGLFLTASIFVRYSSVFAAFGTGVGIFAYMALYERKSFAAPVKPAFNLAMLVALPTIGFGYLMYRTYIFIGTLDRYSGSKTPETVASTAKRWLAKSSELIGFTTADPANGLIVVFWFLIFSLLVAGIISVFLYGDNNYLKPSSKVNKADYLRLFTLVATFHCLSLVVYLSINSVRSSPLEIITRYLYQIYPSLYALFCYMLYSLFKYYNSGKKQLVLKISASALIALYLVAQLNSLRVTRPIFFRDAMITVEMMELPVNDSTTVKDAIKHCFANGKLGKSIWSPHAQPIHLHTGIPTISQIFNYTDKPFDASAFHDRIMQYQTGMFVFINFLDYPNEKHDQYMKSAKNWLIDNNYLEVALQSNTFGLNRTVEIYSIDPECHAS